MHSANPADPAKMTRTLTITPATGLVDHGCWQDANALDAALYNEGWVRSDAGFQPGDEAIVAQFGQASASDLSEITAMLAVQRGLLTVGTCDDRQPEEALLRRLVDQITPKNELHSALLEAEIKVAITKGMDAGVPSRVHRFEKDEVETLLVQAVQIIDRPTTEQLAVVFDLGSDTSLKKRFPISTIFLTEQNRGASDINPAVSPRLRNILAWCQRNKKAEQPRLERYLAAYDMTISKLTAEMDAI